MTMRSPVFTMLWAMLWETWRGAFFSRDSLLLWALKTHGPLRARYEERLAKYDVVRLRSPSDTDAWLAGSRRLT